MLDKDNIISTSVSEAVEKIPTDEKDYCKRSFMCFTLFTAIVYKGPLCTATAKSRAIYS